MLISHLIKMKTDILNIVVAGIRWGDKWLLIHRSKGDYQKKWALVGGKLEKNEELKEAIDLDNLQKVIDDLEAQLGALKDEL